MTTIRWQKIEAAFLLIVSTASIYFTNESWWWIAAILVPDIFMLGYVANNSIGAFIYNLGHSLILPLILLIVGLSVGRALLITWSCVWCAHIGMDRMLGYGLKKRSGFRKTHLGELS